jgi:hypothetical protein
LDTKHAQNITQYDGIKPTDIWLSQDPFHHHLILNIAVKGQHPFLGLHLKQSPHAGRLQLQDIKKGTPAAKLPRWRSTIKRALLLKINNQVVHTTDDVKQSIADARAANMTELTFEFATITPQPLHPIEGSLMLYYDQLNTIAHHLKDNSRPTITQLTIDHTVGTETTPSPIETTLYPAVNPAVNPADLGTTFTLKQLKKRDDWLLWHQARYKMLDSYKEQGMFSEPMELPHGANVHHMLWRYTIKMCATRKARMVCDGSARQGTITLGHTFANSLDAASERLFWAVAAKRGLKAYGADCSNAFAEAPPPVHPLYMRIDEAYHDWWVHHLKNPPIPPDKIVVRVQNAVQGHPEAARLWEKLIDSILKKIGFKATTHEPCLYYGTFEGQYTLFLRQVDDFAIATTNEHTANTIITSINNL